MLKTQGSMIEMEGFFEGEIFHSHTSRWTGLRALDVEQVTLWEGNCSKSLSVSFHFARKSRKHCRSRTSKASEIAKQLVGQVAGHTVPLAPAHFLQGRRTGDWRQVTVDPRTLPLLHDHPCPTTGYTLSISITLMLRQMLVAMICIWQVSDDPALFYDQRCPNTTVCCFIA